MNNKILSAVLIMWIAATWFASFTSADDKSETKIFKEFKSDNFEWFKKFDRKHRWMEEITDEEKIALESMSLEEKKAFFETKKTEKEAKEAVIDTLLAGKTLTSEQETLRDEIIKERAERKQKRLERETKQEEIKEILEKKKSWEELSDEEKTKLDEFKEKFGEKKRGGKKRNKRLES